MALLNDGILQQIKQMGATLKDDVKLVVFTSKRHCDYCKEIVQLVKEVVSASNKITAEIYDLDQSAEKAQAFNIQRAPAIAIVGAKDYGLRYYGIPSGMEFNTLLHGIQKAGLRKVALDNTTTTYLRNLKQPVNLKVFVTLTCPHCPPAAALAYEMALASDRVTAEVIESMEFQELAMQHNVMGVPLNVINDTGRVEGSAPPQQMLREIRNVVRD